MQVNNKLRPWYMALEQELEEAQRKLEGGQSWGLSLVIVEKVFFGG